MFHNVSRQFPDTPSRTHSQIIRRDSIQCDEFMQSNICLQPRKLDVFAAFLPSKNLLKARKWENKSSSTSYRNIIEMWNSSEINQKLTTNRERKH